jgi:hypothetical protein
LLNFLHCHKQVAFNGHCTHNPDQCIMKKRPASAGRRRM